jgi:hypothetical protein
MGTYLEMLRVVKVSIDTKIFCLKIRPENKIEVSTYFAINSEKRINVTGFIVYLMTAPFVGD